MENKYKINIADLTEEDIKELLKIRKNYHITVSEMLEQSDKIISYYEFMKYIKERKRMNIPLSANLKIIKHNYEYYQNITLESATKWLCTPKDMDTKISLEYLEVIHNVVKSDLSDYEKAYYIFRIYPTYQHFDDKYRILFKRKLEDEKFELDKYSDAINDFDYIKSEVLRLSKIPNISENVKYRENIEIVLERENYLDNYQYAEYLINLYNEYKFNHLKKDFLKKLGISEETFNYCVELIKFLNPLLYEEYAEEKDKANKRRSTNIASTLANLAYGIKNGHLPNGTTFDILVFYKKVPFKNFGKGFSEKLKEYMFRSGFDKDIAYTIFNYLKENKIYGVKFVNEKMYLDKIVTLRGVRITNDMVMDAFKYMKINGLPSISAVYNEVMNRIIDGKITSEDLIENKDETMGQNIGNPYELVRKKYI